MFRAWHGVLREEKKGRRKALRVEILGDENGVTRALGLSENERERERERTRWKRWCLGLMFLAIGGEACSLCLSWFFRIKKNVMKRKVLGLDVSSS
ncbi:unnamed protein product [Prunus armeniaca]